MHQLDLEIGDIFSECPHIGDAVFHSLFLADSSSLLACRLVCTDWKAIIDSHRLIWKQIQSCARRHTENSGDKYNKVVHEKWTPLHSASQEGNVEFCRRILGVVVDKNPADSLGWTPLHLAAKNGHLEICELLLDATLSSSGSGLQQPNRQFGFTPLHYAAKEGHLDVCRLILERVEDKNPEAIGGWTPLHSAADNGHLEVCKLLVSLLKRNKNPADDEGETPLDRAALGGHRQVVNFLKTKMYT